MESVEKHIEHDKKILDDPTTSAQARRHVEEELDALERWVENHPNDHHDPTGLELYCNDHPDASECRIYED
jgi:CP12 domain